MTCPKRKYPQSRQGKRRSHLRLTAPAVTLCPQCRQPKMNHEVCRSCGRYNGRVVIEKTITPPSAA
ncbi:MAG: 50S ribosomal protein L32 [Dehalococcoidia bacterium]|nr:50S ribosomal protein L32 [Dehalococcoidia bacterium]